MDTKDFNQNMLKEILKEAGAGDLFDYDNNGSFRTIVHTGNTIEGFVIIIDLVKNFILVRTHSFLGVTNENNCYVEGLLNSINYETLKHGLFYIDKDNRISFSIKCSFNEFRALNNPFNFIFYGCQNFNKYSETILMALSRRNCFYYRNGRDKADD